MENSEEKQKDIIRQYLNDKFYQPLWRTRIIMLPLISLILIISFRILSKIILRLDLLDERLRDLFRQIQLQFIAIANALDVIQLVDIFILLQFFIGWHLRFLNGKLFVWFYVVGFKHLELLRVLKAMLRDEDVYTVLEAFAVLCTNSSDWVDLVDWAFNWRLGL